MSKVGEWLKRAAGAPIRLLLPKNPWLRFLVFLVPVLLVLAILEPFVNLLAKGADLGARVLTPLFDNPVGRLVLLNLLLIMGGFVAWRLLRNRVRGVFAGLHLRRHMEAVQALVLDQPARAREYFTRVAKRRGAPPVEYPALVEDARLKLARLALQEGLHNEAMAWLARVREHQLPKELRRSLVQLRAEVYLAQGEILPETAAKDLDEALRSFPDDRRLLELLRGVLEARGELAEVARVQERVARAVPPHRRAAEEHRLVLALVAAGSAALARGELDAARGFAKRALAVDESVPAGHVLMGRVLLAKGDPEAAAREWGRSGGPDGLLALAQLLQERPGVLTPRQILAAVPRAGALLLVAREYARAGEVRKALRAAERAARDAGFTPSVAALLAEVLLLCGRAEEAARVCEQAVRRLVAPEPSSR
ncbi:MAG: tetratricopeptide repeat protein [Planctomycetes bacterium]|nr:tetratricopeptide repeat protein [Planctomycetota bacterium]